MTNNDNVHRHRSKFNKGKVQKKKKQRSRRKPGSQEELDSLVETLKAGCPNREYAVIVTSTIRYLIRVQELTIALEVYNRYNTMRASIAKIQSDRMEETRAGKLAAEKRSRGLIQGGPDDSHVLVELPLEKEVDALSCALLEPSLVDFFGFLPGTLLM